MMDLFKFKPMDFFAALALMWAGVTLVLNLAIPHSWFFTYNNLAAETPVCQNDRQEIQGNRWALIHTPSSGVDQIFPVGINEAADRFPWGDGSYPSGVSTSTWFVRVNVDPGMYVWKATTLRLDFLYVFPIYLDESERPISNTFEVIEC